MSIVQEPVDRACFALCLALGRLLRATTYSRVSTVYQDGERRVRKHRRFYAPLLVWLGDLLLEVLDTGVQILSQQAWEERERRIYWSLGGESIQSDADGALVLPYLPGQTLASVLENPALGEPVRQKAIASAVGALAAFHHLGFTHADAMADNVLVSLEDGTARWFDFETVHDSRRPMAWRRADDLRALLVTCMVRTAPEQWADTLDHILDAYQDEGATRLLATRFASVWQRPLIFHLAQAGLSFLCFREIGRLLKGRLGG